MRRRYLSVLVLVAALATVVANPIPSFADDDRGHGRGRDDGRGALRNDDHRDRDRDRERDDDFRKVGICHATGSERHPFVFIRVSEEAVIAHQLLGDIIGVNSPRDCPPQADRGEIRIANATCREGEACIFTVTQSRGTATANVTFATEDRTATGGAACTPGIDYVTNVGTIPIGPSSSATISVQTCADNLTGPNERFRVRLTGTSAGRIERATARGLIIESSSTAPTTGGAAGSITIADTSCAEGSLCIFTVTQTGGTAAATVTFSTGNGSAFGGPSCVGFDYMQIVGGTIVVPANGSNTLAVQTCSDALFDPSETFFVVLSSSTSGTITDNTGVGTII